MTVPAEYAEMRFWRDTEVANLAPGGQVQLATGTVGYEWDPEYPEFNEWYPDGRILLSTTTIDGEQHHLSLYRAPPGALVFGAGTVQWAWGLDANSSTPGASEDANMQQATANLLADMGAQPATLQTNLVPPTPSTDTTPPTVTVTRPQPGSTVPGGAITVTGTAADVDGAVAAIEVSTDDGATWQRATGRSNWTHTFSAPTVRSTSAFAPPTTA